jgi:hypothetical protein
MASDLPDMRPDTSLTMARMLVKTMACDEAVQMRLREDFDHPPALRTIRQLRIEEALGRLPTYDQDPWKAHDGYYPNEVSERAAIHNKLFLDRLRTAHPERFAA